MKGTCEVLEISSGSDVGSDSEEFPNRGEELDQMAVIHRTRQRNLKTTLRLMSPDVEPELGKSDTAWEDQISSQISISAWILRCLIPPHSMAHFSQRDHALALRVPEHPPSLLGPYASSVCTPSPPNLDLAPKSTAGTACTGWREAIQVLTRLNASRAGLGLCIRNTTEAADCWSRRKKVPFRYTSPLDHRRKDWRTMPKNAAARGLSL
ncbi:hypothetical protein B0H13DRAFT_1861813 [Mycena leptocephala]|nr:hypothetical protein B0H13DRAFT_1861813 [Mycena leptocephala]